MSNYPTTSQTSTSGAYYNTYSGIGLDESYYKGNISTSLIGIYFWNRSGTNTWSTSTSTTTNLNTNFLNSFGATWQEKIADATWYVSGYNTNNATLATWQDAESTGK